MQLNNEELLQNNNNSNAIISSKRILSNSSQRQLSEKSKKGKESDNEQKQTLPNMTSQASLISNFHVPLNLIPYHSRVSNTNNQISKLFQKFKAQADSCIQSQPLSDRKKNDPLHRPTNHSQTVVNNKNNKKIIKGRVSIFRRAGAKLSIQKSTSTLRNETVKIIEKTYNASNTKRNMQYIKIIDIILAFVVTGNIILSIIENEIQYKETENYFENLIAHSYSQKLNRTILDHLSDREITGKENILRWINIILIIVMWSFNTAHYILQMLKMRRDGVLAQNEGMWASGLIKYCLFETFIIGWFNPPNFNFFLVGSMVPYDYAVCLGSIICIITMAKSYLIIRVYSYISKWTTETAKRICNSNNVNSGVHFALKADLKQRPFSMLTLVFGSAILSFALALRSFEYFTISQSEDHMEIKGIRGNDNHLKDFVNSIWITIITMTTVGYGDYVPKENYGRVICIISCIIGLLLVSIIVVSLEMITGFSPEEKKAYSIIKKITADQNVILKASEVIISLSALRIRSMSKKVKLSERFVYIMKLKQSISSFKDDFKIAKAMDLPLDQTLSLIQKRIQEKYANLSERIIKLESLRDCVDNISTSQKYCLELMAKINKRQKLLGEFLVDLNNQQYKHSFNYDKNNLKGYHSNIQKTKTLVPYHELLTLNSKSTEFLTKNNDNNSK